MTGPGGVESVCVATAREPQACSDTRSHARHIVFKSVRGARSSQELEQRSDEKERHSERVEICGVLQRITRDTETDEGSNRYVVPELPCRPSDVQPRAHGEHVAGQLKDHRHE